ncbi:MAG: ABC transporter permease [Methanomassiliicoccales archaeon]|nr:ABC transporter permease [Methanomassiliicoccales archaeon]
MIILIVITLNFLIPRVMPGDPLINVLGEDAALADPALIAKLELKYGLDSSLWDQYLDYIGALFQFDLGYSIDKSSQVSELISENMCNTLLLILPALAISSAVSLLTGSWCGLHRGKFLDRLMTPASIIIYCMPTFMLAMIALSTFAFHLQWFPLGHQSSSGLSGLKAFFDTLYHLALPITVLTIIGISGKHLVLRNSVMQIADEDFILVARSKGYNEETIVKRHVLRNVLPPFIAMVALNVGLLVEGAVIIEIIFSLNGMGTLLYDAVMYRDYPLIQGCFLVLTFTVLISNLVADILYGLADPRIRDSARCSEEIR